MMKNIFNLLLIFSVTLLFFNCGGSGENSPMINNYQKTNYNIIKYTTVNTGSNIISENDITSSLTDINGNIWFGTDGAGIMKFDGINWENITEENPLSGVTDIRDIVEDKNGKIYFGTGSGIKIYDGTTWSRILGRYPCYDLCIDTSGVIWIGRVNQGLLKYDGDTIISYTGSNGLADSYVFDILQDSNGNIWVATNKGISIFNGTQWDTFTPEKGLCLYKDNQDTIWVGMDNKILKYNGNSWDTFVINYYSGWVYSIYQDSANNIWCSTNSGAFKFDGDTWFKYVYDDGLSDTYVNTITQSSNGTMWFGTKKGITSFSNLNWKKYNTHDDSGLCDNNISNLYIDNSNNYWCGTSDEGISKFNQTNWLTYNTRNGLSSDNVYSIFVDSDNRVWIGNNNGIDCLNSTTWSNYIKSLVNEIWEDSSGIIWCIEKGKGCFKYNNIYWDTFVLFDAFNDTPIECYLGDKNNNLWLGTSKGIYLYNGTNWKYFNSNNGLNDTLIFTMYNDRNGIVCAGAGNGIYKYINDSWIEYLLFPEDLSGTPNRLYSIYEDSNGIVWVGTYSGLWKYDGANWSKYTSEDGLSGNAVRKICEDRGGNIILGIYWGGINKIIIN